MSFIETEPDIVAFEREYQGEKLITVVNRSSEAKSTSLNTDSPYPGLKDLISGEDIYIDLTGSSVIEPYGVKIIKVI